MAPSCPHMTTCRVPQEKFLSRHMPILINPSFAKLIQSRRIFFYCEFMDLNCVLIIVNGPLSRSINTQKKKMNLANIQQSLPHPKSITDRASLKVLLIRVKIFKNFPNSKYRKTQAISRALFQWLHSLI